MPIARLGVHLVGVLLGETDATGMVADDVIGGPEEEVELNPSLSSPPAISRNPADLKNNSINYENRFCQTREAQWSIFKSSYDRNLRL